MMKCFNHPYRDAVAICNSCGRALCPQCAVPAENDRIACVNLCEADVIALGSYVAMPKEKKSNFWKVMTLILLAVASYIFALLDRHFHWTDYSKFWFILPVAFLVPLLQIGLAILGQKWAEKLEIKKLKTGKENKR
jgi:uncharacterized membrane protein YcjF (UPF0283 family)